MHLVFIGELSWRLRWRACVEGHRVANVAEWGILGAPDQCKHASVIERGQIFGSQGREPRSAAHSVVAHHNQRSVAKAGKIVATGKLVSSFSGKPECLVRGRRVLVLSARRIAINMSSSSAGFCK
jgi:hypothetical protein